MKKWSGPATSGGGSGTRSVTFRGNRWYRHSEQVGSHAIDFMQEFFGMNFPEAVTYLLNGETGQVIQGKNISHRSREMWQNRKG